MQIKRENTSSASSVKKQPTPTISFPASTEWLFDELIPHYVKSSYSPQESWKDKPFVKDDVRFFSKGVLELSDLFTEDRSKLPNYLDHPKYRSAYLLYFLPLQLAKFLSLFQRHSNAMEAALSHAKKTGTMRVLDLGAGPGTGSLALLLYFLAYKAKTGTTEIPNIEFTWIDTNSSIMRDGKALAEELAGQFPKLRGKVSVTTIQSHWWEIPKTKNQEYSLILMGHVLNEATPRTQEELHAIWPRLIEMAHGGGILLLEPAARRPSQQLSQLRETLLAEGVLLSDSPSFWGPCLHNGICPLSQGRDWCHFSIPIEIPGKWFKAFSIALGSERQWLKFSYLWVTGNFTKDLPAALRPKTERGLYLVISDSLSGASHIRSKIPAISENLLCTPEQPEKLRAHRGLQLWRGDVIMRRPISKK